MYPTESNPVCTGVATVGVGVAAAATAAIAAAGAADVKAEVMADVVFDKTVAAGVVPWVGNEDTAAAAATAATAAAAAAPAPLAARDDDGVLLAFVRLVALAFGGFVEGTIGVIVDGGPTLPIVPVTVTSSA